MVPLRNVSAEIGENMGDTMWSRSVAQAPLVSRCLPLSPTAGKRSVAEPMGRPSRRLLLSPATPAMRMSPYRAQNKESQKKSKYCFGGFLMVPSRNVSAEIGYPQRETMGDNWRKREAMGNNGRQQGLHLSAGFVGTTPPAHTRD